MLVEESRNNTSLNLKDQHRTFYKMADRSGGEYLVRDIIKLDLKFLGDDAVIMNGEEKILINGSVEVEEVKALIKMAIRNSWQQPK